MNGIIDTLMFSNVTGPKVILKNNVLLLALITVMFFMNFYNKTLFYRPVSIHQWRQTDCLSMTKNYYEEGMNFFHPKIHWQGVKDGQTVSECPILNYTVACLWQVFGEHEFIYRLLEYLIFISAMFVLFNTVLRLSRSSILAFFVTGIFLTSPLLVYYSFSFIADVPALSFCIMCYCLFFKFYNTKVQKYFYLALLFGTLAVLMKASALIGLSMLLFFSVVDIFNLGGVFKTEKLFQKKTFPVIFILLSVGVIIGWYQYAFYYNNYNKNNVFLLTILPIWEMAEADIVSNTKLLFNTLFPIFLSRPMFFLFFCFVFYVAANFKKLSSFLKYSFVFSGIFFVMYVLFFFQVFTVHDYYLNNLMIFPVITFLGFAHIVSTTDLIKNNRVFLSVTVLLIIFFNAMYSAAIYRLRMIEKDAMPQWMPFISREEQQLQEYIFWEYGKGIKNLEEITPELRKAGIKRTDRMLCVPDISGDVSLYLMDQKGFTISPYDFAGDPNSIFHFANKQVKYLVVSDTVMQREEAFKKVRPNLELVLAKNQTQVYKFKTPL